MTFVSESGHEHTAETRGSGGSGFFRQPMRRSGAPVGKFSLRKRRAAPLLRRLAPRLAACLLLLFGVPSSVLGEATKRPEHDFVGAAKCKSCHKKELIGDQYGAWSKGPHVTAFETLANEASARIVAERGLSGSATALAECLRCHATAHGIPEARIAYPVDLADGVQCESCHGPGRDYRKKKIMSDPKAARRKGLWNAGEDEALCTACHNEESPTFDPERYTRADGTKAGFDFEIAKSRIPHPIPEEVKGQYLKLEKKQKEEAKKRKPN